MYFTINIIDLKEEVQFVHFRAMSEESESIHQLLEVNVATAISIK